MMNARLSHLTLILLFAIPLYARDKTDVMVMTNGDRLTCEVKGLDAGVLYVSFDYIDGTALVDWSKVVPPRKQTVVSGEDGERRDLQGETENSRYTC